MRWYIRFISGAFRIATGMGIGDLKGIEERLPYLQELGD